MRPQGTVSVESVMPFGGSGGGATITAFVHPVVASTGEGASLVTIELVRSLDSAGSGYSLYANFWEAPGGRAGLAAARR